MRAPLRCRREWGARLREVLGEVARAVHAAGVVHAVAQPVGAGRALILRRHLRSVWGCAICMDDNGVRKNGGAGLV